MFHYCNFNILFPVLMLVMCIYRHLITYKDTQGGLWPNVAILCFMLCMPFYEVL